MVKAEALQILAQPISISTVRDQGKDGRLCIRLDELEHPCGLMVDLGNIPSERGPSVLDNALQELATTKPCMFAILKCYDRAARTSQHLLEHSEYFLEPQRFPSNINSLEKVCSSMRCFTSTAATSKDHTAGGKASISHSVLQELK